jgi:flagellar biosynthetic protein FliR
MQILVYLLHEIAIGLIIGAITRLVTLAASIAGSTIAFQIGLSGALGADPSNGGIQGVIIGSFLTMLGTALIFATDLHHVALMAIRDSYMIFSPTDSIMWGDAAQMAIQATSSAFVIGVQMSAPFLVLGLVFYLGMGLLGRMMPQLQVFFVAMPATIWVGLGLLALLLTMMMGWYLTHFENELAIFRGA